MAGTTDERNYKLEGEQLKTPPTWYDGYIRSGQTALWLARGVDPRYLHAVYLTSLSKLAGSVVWTGELTSSHWEGILALTDLMEGDKLYLTALRSGRKDRFNSDSVVMWLSRIKLGVGEFSYLSSPSQMENGIITYTLAFQANVNFVREGFNSASNR